MSQDSLEAFEALYHDLEALRDLDRLARELEAHIEPFRALLHHAPRNRESRAQLQAQQKLTINDTIYEVNDDFRNSVLQLADELDADELLCAKLLLEAQIDANDLDRSPTVSAIMRFHRRRQYLLECLRMAYYASVEGGDVDEQLADDVDASQDVDAHRSKVQSLLGNFADLVINSASNAVNSPSDYWQKCLHSLQNLEDGLHRVANRIQRAAVVGQTLSVDEEQIMMFEKDTLTIQHESLASIITFLVSQGRVSSPESFRQIINRLKKLDKHDLIMLHYLPIAMSCVVNFGSSNGTCTEQEAKQLHDLITDQADVENWTLRNMCRAFRAWWIAEYKGRYSDDVDNQGAASGGDAKVMLECLRDGGLQFMLSIAQDSRRNDWHDPAKLHLTSFLLKGTGVLPSDAAKPAPYFQELMMEQFQSFIDAFISNMPDTLRQLKFDEDDQRKLLRSRFQNNTAEYAYDLDRFLTIIAYAYQDSPESAKSFWADTESNLYGFLQWAAKRQTTPRAAAFCEMLRSLSEGEQCADSAHAFLSEEGIPVAGKLRRNASLSWNQIFAELEFYASQTKERQALTSAQLEPQFDSGQLVEPESTIMLECYLRLTTHLCAGSHKVRSWLLAIDEPPLPQLLLQLVSTTNDGRVRAWCLTTLASLLGTRTTAVNDTMWDKIDQWVTLGASSFSLTTRTPVAPVHPRPERSFLDILALGFEESNGFVHLLNALIVPTVNAEGLNDQLPFPETLGSPHRLPGIGQYVDFVLGRAFADKTIKLSDPHQLNLMRLNCLDFVCNVLNSFNEDLVIIANLSNDSDDVSIRSSSLESYVILHPFSRVMEWLHEDHCLDALFAASKQDIHAVNHALSDSPLVLSLVRAIEVMNLVIKMQPMYFDVVRPFLQRRDMPEKPVTRSPVPSFEDAVLKRLGLVVDIGLYCGLGHSDLTLASLALLEKLSSSRRLNVPVGRDLGEERNRLIAVLRKDNEVLRISRALTAAMAIDTRELEAGPLASGYSIKAGILSFLRNTIKSNPDKPNLAYLLLGFSFASHGFVIEDVDGFQNGQCLFFSIARLSLDYPEFDGNAFLPWATNIKMACTEILRMIWRSPVSSSLVMSQLRESDFGFLQAMRQTLVGPRTLWDSNTINDPAFMITESATALSNFLHERAAFFDFFARELQSAKASGANSHLNRLQQSLLGSTSMPGEPTNATPNLFELFDFMELDISAATPIFPHTDFFRESQFDICIIENTEYGPVYDMSRAEEIILLRKNAVKHSRPQPTSSKEISKANEQELAAFEHAASHTLCALMAMNQWREVATAHQETLSLWIRLTVVMVQYCDFDQNSRAAFFQQAYQLLVPKFEKCIATAPITAFELASLFLVLFNASSFAPAVTRGENGRKDNQQITSTSRTAHVNATSDVEFQVFRAALNAATGPTTTLEFRVLCYQICNLYLRTLSGSTSTASLVQRNVLRSVRLVHGKLIEIVCDDAYASLNRNGIGSLLLLEALVSFTATETSKLLLDSLERLNFVTILVDSIRQIPINLRQAPPAEISIVLQYHTACLALLLRLAQTRGGAAVVYNAGLMSSIRESDVFSADPDVGLEMSDSDALTNFYGLMLAILRIMNSIVIKHQSKQVLAAARGFITDHRMSIIGILKRYAAIGGLEVHRAIDLTDLVDNITVLLSATTFLEFEKQSVVHQNVESGIFS